MFFSRAKTLAAGLSLVVGSATVALAQNTPDQKTPEFKVGVSLVNVLATVRDHDNRIVNNLTKDDFILEEDGKPQEITNFFRETDLPLTIGLLVDTSISQRSLIRTEQSAALEFFDHVLRPDRDLAFLIQFDSDVLLLQDLTPSRADLEDALDRMATPSGHRYARRPRRPFRFTGASDSRLWQANGQFPWPGGGGGQLPPIGGPPGNPKGTVLYDAVFLAADEVLRNEAGRKTIILISDGVDQGSDMSQKQAIETALRADCIVYSIRYYDDDFYRRAGGGIIFGSGGYSALKNLSTQTGGAVYDVSDKFTLAQIFEKIQEELRSQYSLSYKAPPGAKAGFRKISLRAKDKRLKVQTRSGYYTKG
jgi:VWFA-related protein